MRIALLTCRPLPEPDADEPLLLEALQRAGATAEMVAWQDPGADLLGFDLAVLRSTWNYHEHPEAFRAWLDRAERQTRIVNSPAVVRWNLHKGYLRALAAAGVAVVPTEWVAAGDAPVSFAELVDARGWRDVVVKPAISAASARTQRFRRDEAAAAQAFLDRHRRRGDMMLQAYQRSVESVGEHNLVWIAGELTHAVRKAPRLQGHDEAVSAAIAPDKAQRAFAAAVLDAAPRGLTYARIDVMQGDDGRWLLSELELIEPSLFLAQSPAALARFVRVLLT